MTRRRVVTDEMRGQVLRLVRMGWTYTLVAQELHLGWTTVRSICERAGEHSAYAGVRRDVADRELERARARNYARTIRARRKGSRDRSGVLNWHLLAEDLELARAEEIEAIVTGSIGVAS